MSAVARSYTRQVIGYGILSIQASFFEPRTCGISVVGVAGRTTVSSAGTVDGLGCLSASRGSQFLKYWMTSC